MSGPVMGEELYEMYSGSLSWDRSTVNDLRQLAHEVEEGHLIGSDEIPTQPIANELRKTAENIETALEIIEKETSDGYNDLVKAIQWNQTGDYGPDKVVEAWEDYDA